MHYFENEHLKYQNNQLYCESVSFEKLAHEFGTPLYVYSKNFMTDRYKEFANAFSKINHKIFFAAKSNFNLNVIKLFSDLGGGIDVNSAGEFFRTIKAGVKPKDMLLTGVGKSAEEIELGIKHDVLLIKAESLGEVYQINELAQKLGKKAPVAIRVTPDVDPKTHPYITTGLTESKFGIPASQAVDMFIECNGLSHINLCGIDMHIGSQITSIDPYVESVIRMVELTKLIQAKGINIEHFDIGGGFGVKYLKETPFTPGDLAEALVPIFMQLDCEIYFEPGRSLTANGGVLLSKVVYTKSNEKKNFIVIDAAMTELLRPSIYKAYHHIQPVVRNTKDDIIADIVGPVCESGDYLGKDRTIENMESDELVALMSAGAYAMVMSSNYNARCRPPEIIVDGDKYFLTRSRESFEHLLYDEKIVDGLH